MNEDIKMAETIAEDVYKTAAEVESEVEHVVVTLQKNAFQRFPTVFLLTVTFGFTATAYAMEQILSQISFLNEKPWWILVVGVGTLFATGSVYKKLG